MNRLKFSKDQGLTFYKELNERIDEYFKVNGRERTGNGKMYFKIIMYFSLDFLFYFLMHSFRQSASAIVESFST